MARGRERGASAARGCGEVGRGAESGVLQGYGAGWWREGAGQPWLESQRGRRGEVAAREALGAPAEPERLQASLLLFLNLKPKCLLECCTESFTILKRILQITRGNKSS